MSAKCKILWNMHDMPLAEVYPKFAGMAGMLIFLSVTSIMKYVHIGSSPLSLVLGVLKMILGLELVYLSRLGKTRESISISRKGILLCGGALLAFLVLLLTIVSNFLEAVTLFSVITAFVSVIVSGPIFLIMLNLFRLEYKGGMNGTSEQEVVATAGLAETANPIPEAKSEYKGEVTEVATAGLAKPPLKKPAPEVSTMEV